MMQMLRRFFMPSSFHHAAARTVIIKCVLIVLSSATSFIITRLLGVEGKGLVAWLMAYSGFCASFTLFGLPNAARKYIAQAPLRAHLFSTVSLMALAAIVMLSFPVFYVYGMSLPVPQRHIAEFLLALLQFPLMAFFTLQENILIGAGKFQHYNVLLVFEKVVLIGLYAIFILCGCVTPFSIVMAGVLATLAGLTLALRYTWRYLRRLPGRSEFLGTLRTIRTMLFSSYFCNMAMAYSNIILTIVLGVVASAKELGYFAIAKFFLDVLQFIPGTLSAYATPYLVRESSGEGYPKARRDLILLTLAIMMAAAAPLMIFPGSIIHMFFGTAFMPGAVPLRIMAAGMVASGLTLMLQAIISIHPKEWLLMINSAIIAICITVLMFLCRDHLDAVTAAYIYTASYAVGMAAALMTLPFASFR